MWIKCLELTRERRWTSYVKSLLKPLPAFVARTPIDADMPIRVVFVGMGRHAQKRLLPAISSLPGFSVESVVVREKLPADVGDIGTWGAADSGGRGADPGSHFPHRCTTDLDAVLRDPTIQAAVVSVPASISAQISARCMASGMHVYSECPAAISPGDLRQLERAASRAGRISASGAPGADVSDAGRPVFQVGYQLRAMPDIQLLARRMRELSSPWTLDVSFHSIYHLCDLVSFLAGRARGMPQSVHAISRNELKLVFSPDRVVRMVLSPGLLKIRLATARGEPIVLETGSGAAPEHYRAMFLNFESAVRDRESPICSLADLNRTVAIYREVRLKRLIRAF